MFRLSHEPCSCRLIHHVPIGKAVITFGEAKINYEAGQPAITENTMIGSPLYNAGADRGDILLALDGRNIRNARDVQRILAAHKPRDTISISYESLGIKYDTTITLAEDPTLEMLPFEQADMEVTEAMKTFRERWLGSKVR